MRRNELARVGFNRTRHQGLEIPAANQVVALHDFRARIVQRLVDIALHASQLAAQIIHTRQVVFAAVQVFKNQMGCRQRQFCLVDPALDIVAIVIGLAPAFGNFVASGFAHPAQDLVLELALGIGRALHHLLHPRGALQLLGRALQLMQKTTTARILDHDAQDAKDKGHADRHDHDGNGSTGDRQHKAAQQHAARPHGDGKQRIFKELAKRHSRPLDRIALAAMRRQIPLDADFFERGAQAVNVDGECIVVHEGIGVPQVLHDGRARDDLARATQEQREDTQLVFGELGASAGCRVGDHGASKVEL